MRPLTIARIAQILIFLASATVGASFAQPKELTGRHANSAKSLTSNNDGKTLHVPQVYEGERRRSLTRATEHKGIIPQGPSNPQSGETIHLDINTLPTGESVTITFEVTVDSPFPTGVTEVANQGTVSGSNFANVLTDDPDVGGAADPTVTQVVNSDIGVIAINSPVTGCGLSNAEAVSITIGNFTSAPQTGFDVTFKVTGPVSTGPVTENVGSLTVPGSGDEVFTFAATADLSVPGTYTITAFTSLTGDGNLTNDTTSTDVTHHPEPTADAGADKTICPGGSVAIGGSPTGSGGTGTLTFSWSPTSGLDDATAANPTASPSATTNYIVTVTDAVGCTVTDTVTVTVEDTQAPVITVAAPISLWPPDHMYQTISLAQCVVSITDNCAGSIPISQAIITSVSSDEPDDAPGNGDGKTINDIVIASDCKSVQIRRERDGRKNGRVYTIRISVSDGNGNTGTDSCLVKVPRDQFVDAVNDGPSFTRTGGCAVSRFADGGEAEVPPVTPVPEGFTLLQSYPNPFNPSTTIRFGLPDAAHVTLVIYNSLGQLVKTLVSGTMEAGYHDMLWDGTNEGGVDVVSGVYFYRIQAGSLVQTKKMLLLK